MSSTTFTHQGYEMAMPARPERLHARRLSLVGNSGVIHISRLIPRDSANSAGGPEVVETAQTQGTLALDLRSHNGMPPAPDLRLVSGGQVPACRPWATGFAQAAVDVVAGDRSPQQLVRCVTKSVYDDLVRRCAVVRRAGNGRPRRSRLRATVHSVHISHPVPTAAELSIHVRHGQRSRAIAARIEWIDGRWICTALEFG